MSAHPSGTRQPCDTPGCHHRQQHWIGSGVETGGVERLNEVLRDETPLVRDPARSAQQVFLPHRQRTRQPGEIHGSGRRQNRQIPSHHTRPATENRRPCHQEHCQRPMGGSHEHSEKPCKHGHQDTRTSGNRDTTAENPRQSDGRARYRSPRRGDCGCGLAANNSDAPSCHALVDMHLLSGLPLKWRNAPCRFE